MLGYTLNLWLKKTVKIVFFEKNINNSNSNDNHSKQKTSEVVVLTEKEKSISNKKNK